MNLPHAPVYGIQVQERFHDLVIATYGRGFWILDDLTPLQQLTPEVLAAIAEADAIVFADGSGFQHVPVVAGAQALDPAWEIDGLIGSAVLSLLEPCLDRDGQRILWKP